MRLGISKNEMADTSSALFGAAHADFITSFAARSDAAAVRDASSARITGEPRLYDRDDEIFALPFLVSRAQWDEVRRVTSTLVAVIRSYVDTLNSSRPVDEVARRLGLAAADVVLARRFGDPELATAFARPDIVATASGLSVLEANIDSALGGLGTCDAMGVGFLGSAFSMSGWHVDQVAPSLAGLLARLGGRPAKGLRVAIVDWAEEIAERPWPYLRLAESLATFGIEATILGPDELVGELEGHGGARFVDVIVRGVTPVGDWHSRSQAMSRLLELAQHSEVRVVSSAAAPLYTSKLVLAELSEAEASGSLPQGAGSFIRSYLPWTRRLVERHDSVVGDLVAHVLADKDALVLKPATAFGSRDVEFGATMTPADWVTCVGKALESGGYVVQRAVEATPVMQAVRGSEGLALVSFRTVTSCFKIGDDIVGSCVRGLPSRKAGPVSCLHGAREGVVVVVK